MLALDVVEPSGVKQSSFVCVWLTGIVALATQRGQQPCQTLRAPTICASAVETVTSVTSVPERTECAGAPR